MREIDPTPNAVQIGSLTLTTLIVQVLPDRYVSRTFNNNLSLLIYMNLLDSGHTFCPHSRGLVVVIEEGHD